jgi:drug/metabolite transporter (DMT)-like permease
MEKMTKQQLQKTGTVFILIGFLGAIIAVLPVALSDGGVASMILFAVLYLAAVVMVVTGCMRFALSKGYSKWLGLIGLGGLIGLIVLVVLPDKWVEGSPPDSPTNYPRYPQG